MTLDLRRRGVLLVNQGSPDSWSVKDTRKYLKNFLMDNHVLDISFIFRKLIVNFFMLPIRSKRTAKGYQEIWWQTGSPLIVLSNRVKDLLEERTGLPVALGMQYGKPSIKEGVESLINLNISEILLIPMYPHYAMATYGSVIDKTKRILNNLNNSIDLKIYPPYFDHPAYIRALVASSERYLHWDYDHILFNYHGVPERHIKKTDPVGNFCLTVKKCCSTPSPAHKTCYRHQVLVTTTALTQILKIPREKYSFAFKNKFGSSGWLKPSTLPEITRLAESGVKKLLVICPSFVADNRETLQEIGIRGKNRFLEAGGEELRLMRCLNEHPAWIDALNEFCTKTTVYFS